MSGLTNGDAYTCAVTVSNELGASPVSADTSPITPEEVKMSVACRYGFSTKRLSSLNLSIPLPPKLDFCSAKFTVGNLSLIRCDHSSSNMLSSIIDPSLPCNSVRSAATPASAAVYIGTESDSLSDHS